MYSDKKHLEDGRWIEFLGDIINESSEGVEVASMDGSGAVVFFHYNDIQVQNTEIYIRKHASIKMIKGPVTHIARLGNINRSYSNCKKCYDKCEVPDTCCTGGHEFCCRDNKRIGSCSYYWGCLNYY